MVIRDFPPGKLKYRSFRGYQRLNLVRLPAEGPFHPLHAAPEFIPQPENEDQAPAMNLLAHGQGCALHDFGVTQVEHPAMLSLLSS
jgi:hypothetical protein